MRCVAKAWLMFGALVNALASIAVTGITDGHPVAVSWFLLSIAVLMYAAAKEVSDV